MPQMGIQLSYEPILLYKGVILALFTPRRCLVLADTVAYNFVTFSLDLCVLLSHRMAGSALTQRLELNFRTPCVWDGDSRCILVQRTLEKGPLHSTALHKRGPIDKLLYSRS